MFKENPAWNGACLSLGKGLLCLLMLGQFHPGSRVLGANSVPTFGGNAQHTANFPAAARTLNGVRWQTSIDLSPSGTFIHYGAPLATAANTLIVPVKSTSGGFQVNTFDATTGAPKYTLTTDYLLPTHNWILTYNPGLATFVDSGTAQTVLRLSYAGPGGTVYHVDNADSNTPNSPVRDVFYGAANYQANAAAFNSTVFVNTPITSDSKGNIYFGFRVQGTAPSPLSTTQSGFARITPAGVGTYVLAGTAGDSTTSFDCHSSAPALSNDEGTLYVVVKSAASSSYGYLVGLNATTLARKFNVLLKDPRNGRVNNATLTDDSTASPTVGPDGDVYLGVLGNPPNGSRGFLLHFNADLSVEKTPGGFGWDYTPSIVPASMVPSYTGASSYLIFAKYNNYAIGDGNGENKIALLDPNSTQVDPHPSANGLLEMREVLTVTGPTPDPQTFSGTYPNAKREWCINTAAVNPATKSIFAPNEDGRIHRWDLAANSLSQSVRLTLGIGEPYVPTIIGPDGTVFTLNGTALFALGSPGGTELVLTSSSPDLRNTVVGQTLTFTVTVTVGGSAASGTASFQDVFYPPQSLTATTNVLAQNVSLAAGQASYTSSALAAGSHFVTAIHDQSSANVTRVQQIHLNNSLTALSASSNPAAPGQSIVFTATVTASNGSVPTGMVTFQEGTAVLAQVPLDANGSARFSTSTLTVGNHTITGVYASDTLCAASSGSLTEVIQPSQPAGLRAIPGPNTKQVTLAWTANPPADGVALYEVWRATTEGSNYSQIGTSPGTSFVDTLQKSGQTRWYYIVARNASGNRSIPSVKVAGTAK